MGGKGGPGNEIKHVCSNPQLVCLCSAVAIANVKVIVLPFPRELALP